MSSVVQFSSREAEAGGEIAAPRQEFPAENPAALAAEATALVSLIHHSQQVEAGLALELAYGAFRERKVDFMAVVRDGAVIGLCARGQIGFVMGSRFGFALYSQSPVESVMVPTPLIVAQGTPVRVLLDRALARHGDAFHEDVALVDDQRGLIGLIQAETLAQLQSRLVAEQLEALRRQHETLRRQNLELFRANHAVRQSQGLYLGLFEGHTLGVALLDARGGIHEHNRRLGELLGFGDSPASLISLAAWVDEKERAAFLALLQLHATGKAAPASREFTLQVNGRGPRLFRCSLGWIKETGQVCACLDDITDQRLLERNLLRQEKQTLLDTLVGGIAHELNNKLTPVMGFAELLAGDAPADARKHAVWIRKSVEEAAHIIRQLLQLSKPSSPVLEPVDLRTVIEETLVMVRFQLRYGGCETRTILPAEPVWVRGDPGQLKQVAINLVLNALQAMEQTPGAALTVGLRTAGNRALLEVVDNGCGIPRENLERIFDPFFTTKGPERGTGLGLSICFSLVRQHGGEIAVESEPGKGSQFTVVLPLEDARAAFAAGSVLEEARGRALPDVPAGQRVLVVEDEDVVRKLLQEMLRTQFGCQVDEAANGAEGLAMLGQHEFALVISDIQMPVMNGTEFYRRLCEARPALAARFIFITGYSGPRAVESEIAQWNVPVIAKPFTLSSLATVCGPLLGRAADEARERGPGAPGSE
ncbi:MAG TPA: ATP-binding protein [Opitutaceae bacterium]|nr:ATP-binding protein [Opitutaceae bacterium]